MKKFFILALFAMLLLVAAGCAGSSSSPVSTPRPVIVYEGEAPDIITGTIEMEGGGIITFELYPEIAPQSVRNFVYLARQGFYDGLKFHRIMRNFMIQGGGPDGTGRGVINYNIFGEFEDNHFMNNLKHTRGVISMARANDFNSASSQFFICHVDYPSLDGKYAAFGKVTSGMDVVDTIAETTPNIDPRAGTVAPENMPVIKSITIDGTFAIEEPDKIARR